MTSHQSIQLGSRGGPRRRAFTLIEVTVASAILSIIVVGLSSAIVLATKALPSMTSPAQHALKAADVSQQIMGELRYASSISESSTHRLAFVVPDRNGDSLPDTISYTWSAASGDPLLRQFNSGAAVKVLPDVQEFEVAFDTTTTTEMVAGEGESPTTMLTYHSTGAGYTSIGVTSSVWPGQYFTPSLPADATGWRVTGVAFWARADLPGGGETAVQLQAATQAGLPTGSVLAEKALSAFSLDPYSYQWTFVAFDSTPRLAADEGVCLVLRHLSGSTPCHVLLDSAPSGFVSPMSFLMTTDAGQNWNATQTMSMDFAVYGTYTTPDLAGEVTLTFAQRVTLAVRAGDESSSGVRGGVQLLNTPEVTDR